MDHLNLYLSDKKFPLSVKTKFREYFMCCQVWSMEGWTPYPTYLGAGNWLRT